MKYEDYKLQKDGLNAKLEALEAEYIAANREYADGEIVLRNGKEVVIRDAYKVSEVTGGRVMYHYTPINKDGSLANQVLTIHGHEDVKPTGRFSDLYDDLL